MVDVDDAITEAAGGFDPRYPLVSADRAAKARGTILRFLAAVPDEACVLELRRAIEEGGDDRP
jgi:DNA-binding transcriptional ArsR family regulator